jgi:hypothetical protein
MHQHPGNAGRNGELPLRPTSCTKGKIQRRPISPASRYCRRIGGEAPDLTAHTVGIPSAIRPRAPTVRKGGSVLIAADAAAGPGAEEDVAGSQRNRCAPVNALQPPDQCSNPDLFRLVVPVAYLLRFCAMSKCCCSAGRVVPAHAFSFASSPPL